MPLFTSFQFIQLQQLSVSVGNQYDYQSKEMMQDKDTPIIFNVDRFLVSFALKDGCSFHFSYFA